MKDKIFISHSSEDVEIVNLFIDKVLKLGLGISHDRIFYTSMQGHGVRGGQYIPDRLKEEIHKAAMVFLFISKAYKTSEICLNELGAAWVTLEKENVIPILLPNVDFDDVGFLKIGNFGIKLSDKDGILGLIEDSRSILNNSFKLPLVSKHVEDFIQQVEKQDQNKESTPVSLSPEQLEYNRCFEKSLEPFSDVIRRTLPAYSDGIHRIVNKDIQNKILNNLSETDFLENLWYRLSEGDFYVQSLMKLPTGNWLISKGGWEVKVVDMWVSISVSNQNEFILFKTKALPAFNIESDVGGNDYRAGILSDGTIISETELCNGYALIGKDTVDLKDYDAKIRYRDRNSHWVFFATEYHKVGYNADETIEFCSRLDSGEIELSAESLRTFVWSLNNEPTVLKWR